MQAQRSELSEFPFHGPFYGIQSEMPACDIEQIGFQDCFNFYLRKSRADVRPGFTTLPTLETAICGIIDFYRVDGVRVQCVLTTQGLYYFNQVTQVWVLVPPTPPLSGDSTFLFDFCVVNYQLIFSQGKDPIQSWDGFETSTIQTNPTLGYPAYYFCEIGSHVISAYTTEAGVIYSQRIRYSGAGDQTDYTSFNSGLIDLKNELGPIGGIKRIYQQGYIFQADGLTQLIETGIGTAPFATDPFGTRGKGIRFPKSLSAYGDEGAAYAGVDNIYYFDGTTPRPIGAAPIDGSRRQKGALSSILGEINTCISPQLVTGSILGSVSGYDYKSYWLNIPGGSTWVYNFDEDSWCRQLYNGQSLRLTARMYFGAGVEIIQLIGTMAQQLWTAANLGNPSVAQDQQMLAFQLTGSNGVNTFSGVSESPWGITSGEMVMKDFRHNNTINRFRIVYRDIAPTAFLLTITNENGYQQEQNVTIGTGSGKILEAIVPFKISGKFLTWNVIGSPGQPCSIIELTPYYQTDGEYKVNATAT